MKHSAPSAPAPTVISRYIAASLVLLALISSTGCKTKTSDRDIAFLDYGDLVGLLDNPRETTLVVDVRPREKYYAGHIPGAVSIPLPQLNSGAGGSLLSRATNIVVYADSFESLLSPAAAKVLIGRDYRNVFDFRGGLELWREEGGEVVTSQPPPFTPG